MLLPPNDRKLLRDKRKAANLDKTEIRAQGKRNWASKGSREKTATQNGLMTNYSDKAPVLEKSMSRISVLWRMDKEDIQVISKGSCSLLGGKQHKLDNRTKINRLLHV